MVKLHTTAPTLFFEIGSLTELGAYHWLVRVASELQGLSTDTCCRLVFMSVLEDPNLGPHASLPILGDPRPFCLRVLLHLQFRVNLDTMTTLRRENM